MRYILGLSLCAALMLAGCGSGSGNSATTTEPATEDVPITVPVADTTSDTSVVDEVSDAKPEPVVSPQTDVMSDPAMSTTSGVMEHDSADSNTGVLTLNAARVTSVRTASGWSVSITGTACNDTSGYASVKNLPKITLCGKTLSASLSSDTLTRGTCCTFMYTGEISDVSDVVVNIDGESGNSAVGFVDTSVTDDVRNGVPEALHALPDIDFSVSGVATLLAQRIATTMAYSDVISEVYATHCDLRNIASSYDSSNGTFKFEATLANLGTESETAIVMVRGFNDLDEFVDSRSFIFQSVAAGATEPVSFVFGPYAGEGEDAPIAYFDYSVNRVIG